MRRFVIRQYRKGTAPKRRIGFSRIDHRCLAYTGGWVRSEVVTDRGEDPMFDGDLNTWLTGQAGQTEAGIIVIPSGGDSP
jgi:hypothetical protein